MQECTWTGERTIRNPLTNYYQLLPIITNYHHTQRSVWDQLRHGDVRPDEEGAVGQQGRLRGVRLLPRRGLLLCTGCSSRILMTMMRTAMTTMSNVMAMEASLWQQIPCHQSEMWSEGIATTNARKEETSFIPSNLGSRSAKLENTKTR